MSYKHTQFFLPLLFVLLVWSLVAPPQTAEAVTVGPSKIEASADPGDTIEGQYYLRNEESEPKTYYSSVQKFTEQGSIKKFLDSPTLLSEWILIPESIYLEPGEDKQFPFSFEVPENAPPGGHFGVIWWGTTPPNATSSEQVSITTRAGSLVYVNISGDVRQTAKIQDFRFDKKIAESLPIEIMLDIKNTGTVYIQPSGTVEITSILGNIRASLPINEKKVQVLPGSTKDISVELADDTWYWGPYRADVSFRYGADDNGQFKVVNESKTFWVFGIASTSIIAFIIIFLFVGLPFIIRRYNKWIIDKSQKIEKSQE